MTGMMSQEKLQLIETALTLEKPSYYCLRYRTLKKKPFTFYSKLSPYRHRPWQPEIMDDKHPNKLAEKSRQLGLSEAGISECIHFLDCNPDTKAMYTFPRDAQMKDFSNTRVKPMFSESDYMETLLDNKVDNISLKKIRDSYLFMRSAWGSALGEGTDIDYLAFDEYDRMKDNVELAFQEGLSSSKFGWIRKWSTPSIPGRGINLSYQISDQRRYFWTCEHCGEKQYLTFEDNLIQLKPNGVNNVTQEIEDGTFIIGCKKCKKEINRRATGEWVALYPSIKDTRGYHISQLDACWISADSIMRRKFTYPSKQLFMNYVIGEPYSSSGLIVTEDDVRQSIRLRDWVYSRNESYSTIVAGIDWGQMNWLIVLGITRTRDVDLIYIDWVEDNSNVPLESANRFATILKAYTPNIIVADAGYGADRNSFMYSRFPTTFYACQWTTLKDVLSKAKFLSKWNETSKEVTVDKTVSIQRVLHRVKNRLIGVPPWDEKLAIYTRHLKNMRIMDMEDDGIIYQVATRVGADHLGCALAYALIGADKLDNYGSTKTWTFDFV